MENRRVTLKKLVAVSSAMVMTGAMIMAAPITAFAETTEDPSPKGSSTEVAIGEELTDNNGKLIRNMGTVTNNNGDITYNLETVTNNNDGGYISSNMGTVINNYKNGEIIENYSMGTVVNNNGGEVVTNNGIVTNNYNGSQVYNNSGTVTNNYDKGWISDNRGIVTNNSDGAKVVGNFSLITNNNEGGMINSNYGTVTNNNDGGYIMQNLDTVINNNEGGKIDYNNGTVQRNFGTVLSNYGTVEGNYDNATVEGNPAVKQYWSVIITEDENSIVSYEKHSDNDASDFDYVAEIDKYYLQEATGSGIINIAPAAGKEIKEDPSGANLSTTCSYALTPNENGNGYILKISSVKGATSLTLAQLGLIVRAIQGGGAPVGPASGGSANSGITDGGSVTVVVDDSITISLPRTNSSEAVATAGPAVLGASRVSSRAISLKMSMLTDAQYKDLVIKNIIATPAGETLSIETDRIACFDKEMLEAFDKKGSIDLEVLFPLGGKKPSVMIPAGTDINKLLDNKGYCGFLRLLAILGREFITK